MSQVLQHSYQGQVMLYSEKVGEHLVVVTVGALTSTAVDMDPRSQLVEGEKPMGEHAVYGKR